MTRSDLRAFECLSCGETQVVAASDLGKVGSCGFCGATFRLAAPLFFRPVEVAAPAEQRHSGDRVGVIDGLCRIGTNIGISEDSLPIENVSAGGVLCRAPISPDPVLAERLVRLQRNRVPIAILLDFPAFARPLPVRVRLVRAEVRPRSQKMRLAFEFLDASVETVTRIVRLQRHPTLRGILRRSRVA